MQVDCDVVYSRDVNVLSLYVSLSLCWYDVSLYGCTSLHWRHNDHVGVSNHQPRGPLLNRLFRRRWKKTSKLRVTGLCAGNSPGPVNSPHKGPVTRKMFPFDDVIMCFRRVPSCLSCANHGQFRSMHGAQLAASHHLWQLRVTKTWYNMVLLC